MEWLKQIKLSEEERELLMAMCCGDGWAPFSKVLDKLVQEQEYEMVRYTLINGPDGLVHAKARAEGAAQFRLKLQEFRKGLTKLET